MDSAAEETADQASVKPGFPARRRGSDKDYSHRHVDETTATTKEAEVGMRNASVLMIEDPQGQ
jgi:hypothetical protein